MKLISYVFEDSRVSYIIKLISYVFEDIRMLKFIELISNVYVSNVSGYRA